MRKLILLLLTLLLVSQIAAAAPSFPGKSLGKDITAFDGQVGIYAKNLRTGRTFTYNADAVFPTASTSKLVVALAVYKYLYPAAPPEKKNEYDTDINYMMTVSDNDSFYDLLDEIATHKSDALRRAVKDLKLRKTMIHNDTAFNKFGYHSVTTPYEMARVFETIYWDRYIPKDKAELMKDELANTIYQDEIPRYMLTRVMHKVGELDNVLCDVGIVDDGRDQILISIYTTSDQPAPYASDFIANMSAELYNALRRK